MDLGTIILAVGLLVFVAHFFAWLFSFTKIPDVLLLMLVGIVVGPWLGQITPDFFGQAGLLFSFIVLTIILFEGGTELRWDVIQESWKGTSGLTILSFFFSMMAVGGVVWFATGIPFLLALTLGAIVGGTSSAVVIPILEKLDIGQEAKTTLTIESAVSDVLSVVVATSLLAAYQAGQVHAESIALDFVSSFLGALAIGLVAGVIWSVVLNKVRHMHNSIFTTPAFVFILFGVTEALGLSGPIAALAFGVMMGNIVFFKLWLERKHVVLHALLHPVSLSERERSFFSEVVFILQTFFFVFVGLSVPITNPLAIIFGILLVAIMAALRVPVARVSAERDVPADDRKVMAVMVPKGLAAAVLATLLVQQNVPYGVLIQEVSYIVILVSVAVTSLLVFLVSRTSVGNFYINLVGGTRRDPALSPEAQTVDNLPNVR